MADDVREARLPKWARDELRSERARADRAEAALAEQPVTNTWHGYRGGHVYIPDNRPVYWNFRATNDGDPRDVVMIRRSDQGCGVEIMGGRAISVCPAASNTVLVTFRDEEDS